MSELSKLEHSDEQICTHAPHGCKDDEFCTIHRPSNHVMRAFPQHWRQDRVLMERICPHGVGHPDPDHIAHIAKVAGPKEAALEEVHGCCGEGCCTPEAHRQRARTVNFGKIYGKPE